MSCSCWLNMWLPAYSAHPDEIKHYKSTRHSTVFGYWEDYTTLLRTLMPCLHFGHWCWFYFPWTHTCTCTPVKDPGKSIRRYRQTWDTGAHCSRVSVAAATRYLIFSRIMQKKAQCSNKLVGVNWPSGNLEIQGFHYWAIFSNIIAKMGYQ